MKNLNKMQTYDDYGNPFFETIPKKQAKSYEIELGQNEGAYKEELLIRYGDNTVNHMMNKKQHGTKMNLEDIMKMNEQLKPFQERPKYEGQESYTDKCDLIEQNFGAMDDKDQQLKNLEENLRAEIDSMTESIFKLFEDTQNEFSPKLYTKYKELKEKIKEQKDENANLNKQLDLLMQENAQIMDMVYKVGTRLKKLEEKVGVKEDDVQIIDDNEKLDDNSNLEQSQSNLDNLHNEEQLNDEIHEDMEKSQQIGEDDENLNIEDFKNSASSNERSEQQNENLSEHENDEDEEQEKMPQKE